MWQWKIEWLDDSRSQECSCKANVSEKEQEDLEAQQLCRACVCRCGGSNFNRLRSVTLTFGLLRTPWASGGFCTGPRLRAKTNKGGTVRIDEGAIPSQVVYCKETKSAFDAKLQCLESAVLVDIQQSERIVEAVFSAVCCYSLISTTIEEYFAQAMYSPTAFQSSSWQEDCFRTEECTKDANTLIVVADSS